MKSTTKFGRKGGTKVTLMSIDRIKFTCENIYTKNSNSSPHDIRIKNKHFYNTNIFIRIGSFYSVPAFEIIQNSLLEITTIEI